MQKRTLTLLKHKFMCQICASYPTTANSGSTGRAAIAARAARAAALTVSLIQGVENSSSHQKTFFFVEEAKK